MPRGNTAVRQWRSPSARELARSAHDRRASRVRMRHSHYLPCAGRLESLTSRGSGGRPWPRRDNDRRPPPRHAGWERGDRARPDRVTFQASVAPRPFLALVMVEGDPVPFAKAISDMRDRDALLATLARHPGLEREGDGGRRRRRVPRGRRRVPARARPVHAARGVASSSRRARPPGGREPQTGPAQAAGPPLGVPEPRRPRAATYAVTVGGDTGERYERILAGGARRSGSLSDRGTHRWLRRARP